MNGETRADIARARIASIDACIARQRRADDRSQRIERFARRQERRRKFVRLADLVEFHATEATGVKVNETARLQAYASFVESALNGYFTEPSRDRLQVLFVHPDPDVPLKRWSADNFKSLHETFNLEALVQNYLQWCWLPFDCALHWCEDKKITPPPAWGRSTRQPPKPASKTSRPPISKRKLEDVYVKMVTEAKRKGIQRHSLVDDLKYIRNAPGMAGVSREAVRELRRQFAPPEWQAQGRRQANSRH